MIDMDDLRHGYLAGIYSEDQIIAELRVQHRRAPAAIVDILVEWMRLRRHGAAPGAESVYG